MVTVAGGNRSTSTFTVELLGFPGRSPEQAASAVASALGVPLERAQRLLAGARLRVTVNAPTAEASPIVSKLLAIGADLAIWDDQSGERRELRARDARKSGRIPPIGTEAAGRADLSRTTPGGAAPSHPAPPPSAPETTARFRSRYALGSSPDEPPPSSRSGVKPVRGAADTGTPPPASGRISTAPASSRGVDAPPASSRSGAPSRTPPPETTSRLRPGYALDPTPEAAEASPRSSSRPAGSAGDRPTPLPQAAEITRTMGTRALLGGAPPAEPTPSAPPPAPIPDATPRSLAPAAACDACRTPLAPAASLCAACGWDAQGRTRRCGRCGAGLVRAASVGARRRVLVALSVVAPLVLASGALAALGPVAAAAVALLVVLAEVVARALLAGERCAACGWTPPHGAKAPPPGAR